MILRADIQHAAEAGDFTDRDVVLHRCTVSVGHVHTGAATEVAVLGLRLLEIVQRRRQQ